MKAHQAPGGSSSPCSPPGSPLPMRKVPKPHRPEALSRATVREHPIIKNRVSFCSGAPAARPTDGKEREAWSEGGRRYIQVDAVLKYFPFCEDFGPLNIGAVRRFGDMMLRTRKECPNESVVLFSRDSPEDRTNVVCLIGSWLVLDLHWSVERALAPFKDLEEPLLAFRDATHLPNTFPIAVADVLKGLKKAAESKILLIDHLDLEMYEYADDPEIADLHEVVPRRFVAFRGPKRERIVDVSKGVVQLVASDYFDLLHKMKVSTVVRLNRPEYNKEDFTDEGFEHVDMIFDDCSSPTVHVIRSWFRLCRGHPGAIALHCKAGLGRTGTLIAMWLMRKYHFTAKEVIGFLRVMRPGSVIGPQQQFLEKNEQRLWAMGDPDLYGEKEEALAALEGLGKMRQAKSFIPTASFEGLEALREVLAGRNTQAMLHNTAQRVLERPNSRSTSPIRVQEKLSF